MKYHFKVYKESGFEESGFSAECVELPGCITQGDTMEDLRENAQDALKAYIDEPEDRKILTKEEEDVEEDYNTEFIHVEEGGYYLEEHFTYSKKISWSEENEYLRSIKEDLFAGLTLGGKQIKLPIGITIVFAPTGHGKTMLLTNFCAYLMNRINIIYASLGEHPAIIRSKVIAAMVKGNISSKPISSINALRAHNTDEFISTEVRKDVRDKIQFTKLCTDKRILRLIDNRVTHIDNLIDVFKSPKGPKIIFLDYVQRIHGGEGTTQEEKRKDIIQKLQRAAHKYNWRLVIGAQVNRQTVNEETLSHLNIREAADIEYGADLIIGMWNRQFSRNPSDKMYIEIFKSRGEYQGLSDVLSINLQNHRLEENKQVKDTLSDIIKTSEQGNTAWKNRKRRQS